MTSVPNKRHVLLVAFPGYGHIIPLLELGKKLGKYHDVTFALSAGQITNLTTRELLLPSDPIITVPIEDGITHDFDNPNDSEAMARAFKAIFPSVGTFLAQIPTKTETGQIASAMKPVDIVIADSFFGGMAAVCAKRAIPFYSFQCSNANLIRVILAVREDSPSIPDDQAGNFIKMPEEGKPYPLDGKMRGLLLPITQSMPATTGHILNSCRDMEIESLKIVMKHPLMDNKPLYCVGPLLSAEKPAESANLVTENKVNKWLSRQKANSVVYISFGSYITPPAAQLKEVSDALLELGHPFIWGLRNKYVESLPEQITKKIAGQYEDPESKFLILNWAPQKLVLGHSSTGVFITHCGWNSVIESLANGTPLVAWPMFADQLINGEWVENLGAGVLIRDTGFKDSRIVPQDEISAAVKKVGGWSDAKNLAGSSYTQATEKMSKLLLDAWTPGGSSQTEFLNFVKHL